VCASCGHKFGHSYLIVVIAINRSLMIIFSVRIVVRFSLADYIVEALNQTRMGIESTGSGQSQFRSYNKDT
jgi:hypothetical protein